MTIRDSQKRAVANKNVQSLIHAKGIGIAVVTTQNSIASNSRQLNRRQAATVLP